MKKLVLFFLFLLPFLSNAQQWKRQRREIIVGSGAANFLGDLGGSDDIGTYYLKDLEFAATKTNFLAAYRYRYSQNIYFKGNFNFGQIAGSDLLTRKEDRLARRLEFKSNIWEITGTFEYAITEERIKGRYIRGQSRFPVNIYTILGFGVTFFNPKGKYYGQTTSWAENGKWYDLQPLATEGQGLPNSFSDKKYRLWTFVIPVGIGFKYPITNVWHVGLEYKLVKTFTDYMDDVGGFYYKNDDIKANQGELSAYFADPSIEYRARTGDNSLKNYAPREFETGKDKRGNISKNDSYMFGTLYVAYKLIKGQNKSRVKF